MKKGGDWILLKKEAQECCNGMCIGTVKEDGNAGLQTRKGKLLAE